jgi:hypothetical protein
LDAVSRRLCGGRGCVRVRPARFKPHEDIVLKLFAVFLTACAVALSVTSCGGGDSGTPVTITELQLTDQQQASLQGDWQLPQNLRTTAFIVRSADERNQI